MTSHFPKQFNRTTGLFLLVAFVCLLAFYGIIIFWPQGNPYDEIKIAIPRGSTLSEVTARLVEKRVVSNQKLFLLAVKTLGYETAIPAGTFTFRNANTNYRIIDQLVNGNPLMKKVTLLEGWTIKEVARSLSQELGISEDEILALCYNEQFANKLEIPTSTLEGFLFPDTYYFFEGEEPEAILTHLVEQYRNLYDEELQSRTSELGLNEIEMLILASIIEGEAIYDEERPVIAAVYHNRLKRGMRLQADPTIQYIIEDSPRRLLNRDLKIDSPYNTYLYDGLPPGPINNPGRESILAALYPAENDYLYFVARGDGYHTFSRTQEEHNRAKRQFQQVRREQRRQG